MKKILSILAFAAAVFAGVSCTKTLPSDPIRDSKVTVSSTSLSLMETETAYLIATCYGDAKTEVVAWSTSDRAVASVSAEGKVTAKSAGSATITATAGKWSASCTISVTAYDASRVPVVKIAVDPAEVTIVETRTATVTATYLPTDATDQPAFTWESSDEEIATVAAGVITAVAEGECEVKVIGGNNLFAIVKVTVIPDNKPTTAIALNKTKMRLGKDFEEQLTVTYTPADHTDLPTITWASSDPTVASVSSTGLVKALKTGTTKITATYGSLSASCDVEVFEALIKKAWASEGSRAYPILANASVLNNLGDFTMEAMIMSTDWKGSGALSTVMGVEGNFLIRVGDAGIPSNRLQIATNSQNLACPKEYDLEANKWYHIAVTYHYASYSNRKIEVYINGKLAASATNVGSGKKSFGMTHTNEASGGRVFWLGYAYDNARDLRGGMCEARIWNRVLTAEEINAENHFYQVDPASNGLVAYWKMNEGEGDKMKDSTANGNDLQGEVDIAKQGNEWKGTNGVRWMDVALPE